MNTLILVTKDNLSAVKRFAAELADKQTSINHGKLLVMGAVYLPDEELKGIQETLSGNFEATETAKVQLSESPPSHSQIATMVAVFMMQKYTSVPGPWLIVDDYHVIRDANPLTALELDHNASTAENSGTAVIGPDQGVVPIGPVVLGANVKKMKTLRSTSGESWRQRGRFAFKICSWNQVDPATYPFKPEVPKDSKAVESFEGVQTPVEPVVVKKPKHALPIVPKKEVVEPVEESAPDPVAEEGPTRADLFAEIAELGGKKPHHATGEARLKQQIKDLKAAN